MRLKIELVSYFRIPFATISILIHHDFRGIFQFTISMSGKGQEIAFRLLPFNRLHSTLSNKVKS